MHTSEVRRTAMALPTFDVNATAQKYELKTDRILCRAERTFDIDTRLRSPHAKKSSSVAETETKARIAISHYYLFLRVIIVFILLFILKVTCVLRWYKFLFRFVSNCNRINSLRSFADFFFLGCFASFLFSAQTCVWLFTKSKRFCLCASVASPV